MRFRRTGRTGQASPSSRPDPITRADQRGTERPHGGVAEPQGAHTAAACWIQIIVTALPGLAAVIALIFTWQSINATTNATNRQLQIAEQGQVTDRYNAAITNLGSPSVDVRLGGIYALQRIMQDSPRDQPTVVAVLCAFVRDHARATTARSARPSASLHTSAASSHPPTDIQAALTVVGSRNTAHDSFTTIVDFTARNLAGEDALRRGPYWRGPSPRPNLTDATMKHDADLDRANLDPRGPGQRELHWRGPH